MADTPEFQITNFLPYLLNQAAEESSLEFQTYYKNKYGMLRNEWRVLFHLGRYGEMTATEIVRRAKLHKTKVSRAVAALQQRRYLIRNEDKSDRRSENLCLTSLGKDVYDDLEQIARTYDTKLVSQFSRTEQEILRKCLTRLAKL